MPVETSEWSGYSITAVILVIVAVLMLIIGIVWYEKEGAKTGTGADAPNYTWSTFLIVGGIILFIIALIVGYMGRKKAPSSYNEYNSQTVNHMGSHPGAWGQPVSWPQHQQWPQQPTGGPMPGQPPATWSY